MIQPQHTRLSLLAALLLVTSLATSYLASADPAVNDNGNGTKTAVWDFSNPANYTSSNVAMARNDLRLGSTPGSWLETSDADFIANGSPDAGARVTNGSLRLTGNEANLVANGNFSQASNWTWANGTAGTIVADQSLGTGEFLHATLDNSTRFDTMDTGAGWSSSGSLGATSTPLVDSGVKMEGTGSMRDTITLPSATMWAGISRTGGTWDFSPYNRFSVWLNTSFSGPGQLQGLLHLETGTTTWNSTPVAVPTSWTRVEFNFTGFGSNLTSIIRLDLRFTGAVVAGENVWIDDLWRIYRKTLTDTASISQTFAKATTGNGLPGSVLLRWDNDVSQLSNVTSARLRVVAQNSTGSSQAWSRDLARVAGWTGQGMDLSTLLAPAGTYTIRFELQVAIDTHLPTSTTVHIDNVVLKAPDYRDGVYLSNALDASSPAVWGQLNWTAQVDVSTSISVETRSGSTPSAGDPTWSGWLTNATPGLISTPYDRFLQFRVLLRTLNSSRTPTLFDIRLDYSHYATAGFIESLPFLPAEPLVGWRRFDATEFLQPGTAVLFEIHSNGTWMTVTPGQSLNAFPNTAIQVRASATTVNTSLSPRIVSMSVLYEYVGSLWSATLNPGSWSGNADQSVRFVASGYDRWGHSVGFTPTWETTDPDPSPGGAINGTTGVYNPHTVGTWVVRVKSPSGVVLANATVRVTPGSLQRLNLSPPSASAPAGSRISFFLTGYDGDDNVAVLSSTIWSATSGTFLTAIPGAALLQLPGTPGSVVVTARHGTVFARANVTVTSAGTPVIHGIVPTQVHDEDSTWNLDLTEYARNQPDTQDSLANLSWFLTGKNPALYSVWGENFTGNHLLIFSGAPDAFGTSDARLWLEDRTGARTSQPLRITVRPVNDPPRFRTLPDLPVKGGVNYTFDLEPYIVDVDTPPANLTLTTNDPAHVSVAGLNLTLTYPVQDVGRTIYLRLSLSDGENATQTVLIVKVTTNTPPHVRVPLPDLVLREDEYRARVFPSSLSSYFADDDGDDLFFSYGYRDITVTIWKNATFWQVDVRPNPDWNGVEKVTFRAQDTHGAFAEYSVIVMVTPVNDPPVLSWRDDIFVGFDVPYVLDLGPFIHDVDTPIDALTLRASPSQMIQIQGFVATFLYPKSLLGNNTSYDLSGTLYLNDSSSSTSRSFYVHVSSNRPPILVQTLPEVRFDEDTTFVAYRLSQYFTDPDGYNPLSYNITGVHVRGDIAADTRVTFSAAANWSGQEAVAVRAEDAGRAYAVTTVLVNVNPVDDAPVFIRPLEDRDLSGGGFVVINLRSYVEDVDDRIENLTFTADSTFTTVYGYILILDVPANGAGGPIRVTVTDGRLSSSKTFQLTVFQPTVWAQIYWPWSGVGLLIAAILLMLAWELFLRFPHTLEDVFIIGREGRLILHNTRRLRADRDEDILAGMLTAIMLFVRDSFREEHEDLKQFEFGDRKVFVERGVYCYIAAIFGGVAPPWARRDINAFLKSIETKVGDRIASWSGDRDDVHDLKGMTEDFVRHRRYHRNGRWPFRPRAS